MKTDKVRAVYFSATGTTAKITEFIAGEISRLICAEYEITDFTLPFAREESLSFGSNELVIFGLPVYAGRVPNVLLKYLRKTQGNDALAVPVVLYGNRNYDDALIELRDLGKGEPAHYSRGRFRGGAFVFGHAGKGSAGRGGYDQGGAVCG